MESMTTNLVCFSSSSSLKSVTCSTRLGNETKTVVSTDGSIGSGCSVCVFVPVFAKGEKPECTLRELSWSSFFVNVNRVCSFVGLSVALSLCSVLPSFLPSCVCACARTVCVQWMDRARETRCLNGSIRRLGGAWLARNDSPPSCYFRLAIYPTDNAYGKQTNKQTSRLTKARLQLQLFGGVQDMGRRQRSSPQS